MLIAVDDQAEISVMDESFSGLSPGSMDLHIQLRENGWDAGVYYPAEQRWLGIHSGKRGFFMDRTPDWMNSRFGHTHITVVNQRFTLVPKTLFEEKKAGAYLDAGCGTDPSFKVFSTGMTHLPAQLVFGVPKETFEKLRERFTNPEFHHQCLFTVDPILGRNKNQSGKNVHVQVFEDQVEIMVSDGNQLLLYNVFPYQVTDEAVYHIMNAFEVMRMNPESVPVIIGGQAGKNSTLYSLVYKYVRNVQHFQLPERSRFAYALSEIPAYRFHALLSQCAS